MNYQALLITLFLGLSGPTLAINNDQQSLYLQVYAVSGTPLDPAQTFELIKQLKAIFANQNDSESKLKEAQVDKLIEACNITEAKCVDRQYMSDIKSLIDTNAIHTINIVPYLKSCRLQQFTLCRPIHHKKLDQELDRIKEKYSKVDENFDSVMERLSREVKSQYSH